MEEEALTSECRTTDEVVARILWQRTRFERVLVDSEMDELQRSPTGGGWSAAEVLDHLVKTAREYLEPMERALSEAPTGDGQAGWRWSWVGRSLHWAVTTSIRMPSPGVFRPVEAADDDGGAHSEADADARDDWFEVQDRLLDLVRAAARTDWRRTRFPNPVVPFLRMNLGDGLHVMTAHSDRHLAQIRRVLAESDSDR